MIRLRLYKATTTYDGFPIEVTLLDAPLNPHQWSKRDDAALAKLEEMLLAKIESRS